MGTIRERTTGWTENRRKETGERPPQQGVWEVRAYIGRDPVTNAPRQVSRTVRGGYRAAQDLMHRLETEVGEGKVDGTNANVSTLLARYLDHLERRGLAAQTLHGYRRYVRIHLEPAIGAIPVRKLTAHDLDRLYDQLGGGGRSPATVRQVHAIISGALGQALKWGWGPSNVAKVASPPTVRAGKVVAPTPEQVRRLVARAEELNPTMGTLIGLAALTGARRGELCALRWSDVDFDTGTLRIAHSLVDLPGRLEVKDTKTHAERVIALGAAGVALITLYQRMVTATAGEDLSADAFVFSERLDGATPLRPDKVTGAFTRLRDDLGMPELHFHSLRHFAATTLAATGDISVRTLAGRLGHADPSVTLRVYAAWLPASDTEAAEALGRALGPAGSTPAG